MFGLSCDAYCQVRDTGGSRLPYQKLNVEMKQLLGPKDQANAEISGSFI
jgi:hypothetical protein